MRRRSRIRRVAKWLAIAFCLLIVCVFVASRWWYFGLSGKCATGFGSQVGVGFEAGCIGVFVADPRDPVGPASPMPYLHRAPASAPVFAPWWVQRRQFSGRLPARFWWRIPLWMPFAGSTALALWLWWRDRPYPSGHCRTCGYNLAGNVSGVCPECGSPTAQPSKGRL
jgi:hypothetical protein